MRAIIYTKDYCPYCHKAKALLDQLKVDYTEIEVSHDEALFEEMVARSGKRTVPQIFLHIGGCDELHDMNDSGKLSQVFEGL